MNSIRIGLTARLKNATGSFAPIVTSSGSMSVDPTVIWRAFVPPGTVTGVVLLGPAQPTSTAATIQPTTARVAPVTEPLLADRGSGPFLRGRPSPVKGDAVAMSNVRITVTERGGRRYASSGSRWEPIVGYSRAVRTGDVITITGTVGVNPDGS